MSLKTLEPTQRISNPFYTFALDYENCPKIAIKESYDNEEDIQRASPQYMGNRYHQFFHGYFNKNGI